MHALAWEWAARHVPTSLHASSQCLEGEWFVAGGQNYTHPDVLALLQQTPPDALDQLVRSGYLPNNGSSNSLQGLAHGLGSSAALRSLDSQQGVSRSRRLHICCSGPMFAPLKQGGDRHRFCATSQFSFV